MVDYTGFSLLIFPNKSWIITESFIVSFEPSLLKDSPPGAALTISGNLLRNNFPQNLLQTSFSMGPSLQTERRDHVRRLSALARLSYDTVWMWDCRNTVRLI
jgi:hypothetical protein